MEACCSDLEVDINGEESLFLNKQIICAYSATFRKLLGKSTSSNGNLKVIFNDFPGGAESFELVSRFCYGNGRLAVMPSNVVLMHRAAKFMEVSKVLERTEKCMEEIRYWSWPELLLSLKQCQEVETSSEAESLAAKLMDALVEKLCLAVEMSPSSAASACSPDSSLFRFSCDSKSTESFKNSSVRLTWWFDEVLVLSPGLVETFLKLMVLRKFDNHIISRFLFYYQKVKFCSASSHEKRKILETIIDTLCVLDQSCVPCKGLFGFLRLALGLNINKSSMNKLELMIGSQLDQATLDNLLVPSPSKSSHLYYVNLVLRFTKAFLDGARGGLQLKKVSSLIDQYITEVAPDPCLKPSKFLSLLTLVPDSARESHEEIYRAIDMYLEAHTGLTNGEKLSVIRTLSYEKLSGESRSKISRNPKFQVLETPDEQREQKQLILRMEKVEVSGDNEKLKEHIEGIQWRVMELERACLKMQNQMEVIKKRSKNNSKGSNRSLPKLCS
ncbi:PREDICTED: BTB/POZ domain-containing protein At3g22104-like isoform X1 [Camelina sativa]|uniref:BTB/POZ domain-containing protein At3g22104-like isoform X1 n=2 Tax=Camelina sativa TaxID=90675 RepID=A0ABM0XMR2_CAMSA|nr:PREDICTED: BTB/POZ domain-containing protein At3g22104-like isoform X1 [Camelina sativa]